MQHIKQKEDVFADVIKKIQFLTISQQKFIQELLFKSEKVVTVSKKNILKKSFGVWSDRKDIKDSTEYVNETREGWNTHFARIKPNE